MTDLDLELTRLCAEKMGIAVRLEWHLTTPPKAIGYAYQADGWHSYDPLHDDAQCFALVKRFPGWCLHAMTCELAKEPGARDFNRAIVTAVATMPESVRNEKAKLA